MALTVLVVDDDSAFLSLAERLLEEMGITEILTATNAATAIVRAQARRPQAILVDVGLPDRDGIDLAQELATLPWSPRVVLTSTDRDAMITTADREHQHTLPFVPKDELADGALQSLLLDP